MLAILVAVPAIVYMAGSTLPVAHTATVSRTYDAPADRIWRTITGVRDYPEWRRNVERVDIHTKFGERMRWREFYTDNEPITFQVVQHNDERLFRVRIADTDLPFGGTWTYRISVIDDNRVVSITEEGEIYNPLFRFVSHYITGYKATMNRYLDDLGHHVGE